MYVGLACLVDVCWIGVFSLMYVGLSCLVDVCWFVVFS